MLFQSPGSYAIYGPFNDGGLWAIEGTHNDGTSLAAASSSGYLKGPILAIFAQDTEALVGFLEVSE